MSGGEKGYVFSKLVRINSATALDSSKSLTDWVADLGTTCQQVNRVSFQSVVFNNNGYNINGSGSTDPNYRLDFRVGNAVSGNFSAALDGGFYDITQAMTAAASKINALIGPFGGQSVTFTQDPISYKVSLSYNAGTSGNISFLIQDELGGSAWANLGFSLGQLALTGAPLVATNLPSLTGLRQVYLTSSSLAPGNQIDEKGSYQNVCVNIPVTAAFGAVNVWECKVDSLCQITYKTARNLQRVDFQLRDEDGSIIDLHGGSVKVELRVWFNKAS